MTRSGRPLLVAASTTVAAAALAHLLLPSVAPDGPGFLPALVSGCAVAGLVAVGWCWLLALVVVLEVLRGRAAGRGVPRGVRRLVLAACGATLAAGLVAPAQADPGGAVLSGLPLPDRTTAATSPGTAPGPASGALPAVTRRPTPVARRQVRAGDTLWELARRTLPPEATAGDVDRRWHEIYAANREVVGADPDLIRAGQRLVLPAGVRPTWRS